MPVKYLSEKPRAPLDPPLAFSAIRLADPLPRKHAASTPSDVGVINLEVEVRCWREAERKPRHFPWSWAYLPLD